MKKGLAYVLLLLVPLLTSCGCGRQEAGSDHSEERLVEIPGLAVTGARSRGNVLQNLQPVVRAMNRIYERHRARNPDLKGRMEIHLDVEFNGEIGRIEVVRTTIPDEALGRELLRPLQFADFDGWDAAEDGTEVRFPIVFGE